MPPITSFASSAPAVAATAPSRRSKMSSNGLAKASFNSDYDALQQAIYTRWVNQKLGARMFPTMTDILADLGKDDHLSNLVTALSDNDMPKGRKEKRIVRAQHLDWIKRQLAFVYDCGVEIKLKPSNENILDGDFRDIMGLIYACMLKFLKFDDDDGESSGNAKEALLRWCQYHTKDFVNVNVTNLTKSWQDGMALCALMAKFNPEAINMTTLQPADALKNIQTAMDCATKCFKIEQFLTPQQFLEITKKADGDKAMLVIISEYYYGINDWFKRKLASKRISKAIDFTRENDKRRAQYAETSAKVIERLAASEQLLADVAAVDNTMAGAVKRLADFENYKQNQKNSIVKLNLEMVGNFDTLQLRLTNNKRPMFAPPAETTPDAIKNRIALLSEKEKVEPRLHAELKRQHKLVNLHAKHSSSADKLVAWVKATDTHLHEPITCTNSGDALKQQKLFDTLCEGFGVKKTEMFATLTDLSAELEAEHYEDVAETKTREADIQTGFAALDVLVATNAPILKDNVARELFKEEVDMKVAVHADINSKLQAWAEQKSGYFKTKELIGSVIEARLQLTTLDGVVAEVKNVHEGNFARLKELGDEIRAAVYKTELSEWTYPSPTDVSALELSMEEQFSDELGPQQTHKRATLEDALERETLVEKVANWVGTHKNKQIDLIAWGEKKLAYLEVKETVGSSTEAKFQLSVLEAFANERSNTDTAQLVSFQALGKDICSAEYKSEHSSWAYGDGAEILKIEGEVTDLLQKLTTAHAAKLAILEDDLARELFAEETRLLAGQHTDQATHCAHWATEKSAYLGEDIMVHSVRDAQVALSVLAAYDQEKARFTATSVTSLTELGKVVIARKYETTHSSYTFETPEEITERETEIETHWVALDTHAAARKKTLDDRLAREVRKEELRVNFANAASKVVAFVDDRVAIIGGSEDQKVEFGSTIQEVESHGLVLDSKDEKLDVAMASQLGECAKIVDDMVALVRETNAFDEAQVASRESIVEEGDAGPAPERSASQSGENPAMPTTPRTRRRTRFGTLSKSLKKAFGKNKRRSIKKRDRLAELAGGGAESADVVQWPEESNPYTELSVTELHNNKGRLAAAQKSRRENYASELAQWRADDEVCKKFADAANPVREGVAVMMQQLQPQSMAEEAQLEGVKTVLDECIKVAFKLEDVKMAEAEVAGRGITVNPYTTLTNSSLLCELENVQLVAEQKRPHLETIIEYKKYKGITPEQYAEMETLFKEHDTDGSDSISDKELRKCLFSLGEERSKKEIASYMKTYAKSSTALAFEEFRELMIVLIGDMGTKEGLTESFQVLAGGQEGITVPGLVEWVEQDKVDFFVQEAPAIENNAELRNFKIWVDAVTLR